MKQLEQQDNKTLQTKQPEVLAPTPQPKDWQKEREQLLTAVTKLKAENEQLLEERTKRIFSDDLGEILKAHPEEELEDVMELGDGYLWARSMGAGNLDAYEVAKALKKRAEAQQPPTMGAVGNGIGQRDYFTEKELNALGGELNDPNILQKAIRSLRRK